MHHTLLPREALLDRVLEALEAGKVVAWFQGRFEWGPRALGNRSILADPRRLEMKDVVNKHVKFREPFRPFAPVVLDDRAQEFFDLPAVDPCYPLQFMQAVRPIRPDKRCMIPAVDHVGTARPQTVRRELNPLYYDLVARFGESTGVPLLLNTSFNLRGEPIVASPADALSSFRRSGIDLLVMDQYLVAKDG